MTDNTFRTSDAMNPLYALNKLRWYVRLPIKWFVLAITLLAVCFPNPVRLVRHLRHWQDPNALIEPDAPAIQPFVKELRPRLEGDLPPREALKRVERFVYEKIPYEWDWNTWGMADYLPTVTEVIEMGKEDCDGQAVLAASLLRRFGFNAHLVNDFAHMWVRTDQGETMSPGEQAVVVATDEGPEFSVAGLAQLPRATAFGIAVFPALRELILLGVMWLLLLRRHGGIRASGAGLALFVAGLFLLRSGGKVYDQPVVWLQWMGLAGLAAGFGPLLVWARLHALRREGAGPVRDCTPGSGGGDV